jgi:hypothetical protein
VSRGTPDGDAYLDLKGQAQRTGRPTDELLQLYVLEGFLARLAVSDVPEKFVLKGGVLLAAFDTRRPTRDVDLAGLDLSNDADRILGLVRYVLTVELAADEALSSTPAAPGPRPPARTTSTRASGSVSLPVLRARG